MNSPTRAGLAAAAAALTVGLAACATGGAPAPTVGGATPAQELKVVTHDSFRLTDSLLEGFEREYGYDVQVSRLSDAGAMTNQLVLTKSSPLGDVVFGIDNTFAGRAIAEGVTAPYASAALPADSADLKAGDEDLLTPIDYGDVCVNADKAWFAARKLPLPATLDDLADPAYRDLLVVENPASSSPGLAFLAATVGGKGDPRYLDYWRRLTDNGVKVVKGWTEAYSTEFTAGEGQGTRPLVVSYSTSPAFTVSEDGAATTTTALLDTCFRQVEYAGVIKGARNEAGARAFVDFLLSPEVQADIPKQMYMYPAVKATKLPKEWVAFAPLSPTPFTVTPADIAGKRERWIRDWTATVLG